MTPTLRDAAEYGANLIARRFGYEVRPWRADPKSEGFQGYVEQARQAGQDVNDWQESHLGWVPALPQLERVVFPHLRPNSVVVELGPGTGRYSRSIAARVPDGHLHLVDHSPFMVAFLRDYFASNPRVSVHLNDGASLPFAEDTWADLVFSAGTLIALGLGTIELYLREFRRVLRSGGQAIFDYIDPDTPEGWQHLTSQSAFLRTVYTYHAASAIERVCQAVGFGVGERHQEGKSTYVCLHKL
jgi:ubiquinone/menaquinone biosynthesis C-methylase UbiE